MLVRKPDPILICTGKARVFGRENVGEDPLGRNVRQATQDFGGFAANMLRRKVGPRCSHWRE